MKKILPALTGALLCLFGCDTPQSIPPESILIDTRSSAETASGIVQGAVHVPHDQITGKIAAIQPDQSKPIGLYCRSGGRAGMAKRALEKMGYTQVYNLGGIGDAAKILKRDIVKPQNQ